MRLYFVLILISIFAFRLEAQESYAVTLRGDTLYGDIYIRSTDFFDEADIKLENSKESFKAYQLKVLKIGDDFYRPVAYRNKKVFAQIVTEGPRLSYYLARSEEQADFTESLLIKSNGEQIEVGVLGFRKRTTPFFKDCEFIAAKIDAKLLGFNNLSEILSLYNENCGGDNSESKPVDDSSQKSFIELKSTLEVVSDILRKLEAGEIIPRYQLDALKEYSKTDLNSQLQKLVEAAEKSNNK